MLQRLRARFALLFTGSTIAEIDRASNRVVRVPGFYPRRERSLFYRVWATWRASVGR